MRAPKNGISMVYASFNIGSYFVYSTKHLIKAGIGLISMLLIYQISLSYWTSSSFEQILRFLLITVFYSLVLIIIYRLGRIKHTLDTIKEVIILSLLILAYTSIPILYAKFEAIISPQIDYYQIIAANFVSSVCIVSIFYLTRIIGHNIAKIVLLLVTSGIFIINCLYVSILYTTGFEFGPAVIFHASSETFELAIKEYTLVLIIFISILIPFAFLFYKLTISKIQFKRNLFLASLSLMALSSNAIIINLDHNTTKKLVPTYSLYKTLSEYGDSVFFKKMNWYSSLTFTEKEKNILYTLGIAKNLNSPQITPPKNKKNVIILYLESFQYDFTKQGGWTGKPLTPYIDGLTEKFTIFDHFYNSVTPTINAMISTQCGIDILLSEELMFDKAIDTSGFILSTDKGIVDFYKHKLKCFPDILKEHGYVQIFMKGADIGFSGKKVFFSEHGYDKMLGRDELNEHEKHSSTLNSWGLSDIDLFNEALKKLDELEKKQPFNLSILTINSHSPGFEDYRCPVYKTGNTLLNGIHCTDYAVGMFLESIFKRKLIENTYIILAGDHTLFNSPINKKLISDKVTMTWYGKTYLAIYSPDKKLPTEIHTSGYSPDFAPTVLELLGFQGARFITGKSLFSDRRHYQHLISPNYEIKNGRMEPETLLHRWNSCTENSIKSTIINYSSEYFSECQRARIFAAQQKLLYTNDL